MTTSMLDPVACLAEADLFLLLAEILEPPSSWAQAERAFDPDEVAALAKSSGLAALPSGAEHLAETLRQWEAADPDDAALDYHRLFDGSTACPCNESAYVRRDKGAILADVSGFYRAFGFDVSERFGEKHDHVVAELQFAACLLVLLHRASVSADEDPRDVTREALSAFVRDHLGVWIEAFSARLAECGAPLYASAGRLLAVAWEAARGSHGWTESGDAPGGVVEEPGTPYECGMCDAAPDEDPQVLP